MLLVVEVSIKIQNTVQVTVLHHFSCSIIKIIKRYISTYYIGVEFDNILVQCSLVTALITNLLRAVMDIIS